MSKQKVRMSIYVTPEEKVILQRLADQHMRSLTGEVRNIIVEKLSQENK